MFNCTHCGLTYMVTHENIDSIDSTRMEAVVVCPHCKKKNTVKCAQAEVMTPTRAMETAIREISAYKGEAIDRAVHGAIGAAAALERVGLLSTEDNATWREAARKAGADQQAKIERKTSGKKKR